MADRFPSPFEMPTPPGAEGWQDLYAYSSVFSEDRREYEESQFWFMDGVHSPEAIPPWDATIVEYALIALSQYNTRHYVIPPARGVDLRFLNGYMYLSPVGVTDPAEIEARIPEFAERAGYYFANWDRLYAAWVPKVRALIDELETISFSPLPEREDMAVITEGHGTGSALGLFTEYDRLVDLTLKLWHHHFEFLNLGYAAYLDFFGCCKQLFPSIPDQAIAKMVAGIQVDLFRPDNEVKKLAQLAVDLGLADRFSGSGSAEEVLAGLRGDPQGDKWVAAWDEADIQRGRDRRPARGRGAGRTADRAELGAGVRQDRGDSDRRGRDHEPRRDHVPRVRAARRHRHRIRHPHDQDGPASPGRRQRGHGDRHRLRPGRCRCRCRGAAAAAARPGSPSSADSTTGVRTQC